MNELPKVSQGGHSSSFILWEFSLELECWYRVFMLFKNVKPMDIFEIAQEIRICSVWAGTDFSVVSCIVLEVKRSLWNSGPTRETFARETFQCKKKHGLCTQRKCRINLLFFCLLVLLCFCYFLCWQNQSLMCWVLHRWSPWARFWLSWDGLLPPVLTWHPELPVYLESSLGVH